MLLPLLPLLLLLLLLLPPPGGPRMCHKAGGRGRGGCRTERRGKGSALGGMAGGGEGREKERARRVGGAGVEELEPSQPEKRGTN